MTDVFKFLESHADDPFWINILKSPAESLPGRIDLISQDLIKCQYELLGQIEEKSEQ